MKFYDWYKNNDKHALAKLAKAVDRSPAYLSLVARGHRKASHGLANAIGDELSPLVTREDVSPHIFGEQAA